MKWVLIFAIYLTGEHGGVSITNIEFNSEKACREAGQKMAVEWSRGAFTIRDQSRWVCVER